MLSFAKWVGPCLSLLALGALNGGCAASMQGRLLNERTGAYVFHRAAPDVESAARALLTSDGFHLIVAEKSGVVRTAWRPVIDDEQFATTFERYVIVVQRLTAQHCRVEAIKVSVSTLGMETAHPHSLTRKESTGETGNTATYGKGKYPLPLGDPAVRRDLELEWRLIRTAEPERARVVESDVAWLVAHR